MLGKGLAYVPAPKLDILNERLDMRQTVNRILTASRKNCTPEFELDINTEQIPTKLRHPSYSLKQPSPDKHVNTLIERLVSEPDSLLLTSSEKKTSLK